MLLFFCGFRIAAFKTILIKKIVHFSEGAQVHVAKNPDIMKSASVLLSVVVLAFCK